MNTNHYILTFLVDSNPATGATNVNTLGSKFTVNFQSPLIVPKEAINCNIKVKRATVWFVTPNITVGVNSNFRLTYQANTFDVVVPTGLYTVTTLSTKLQALLLNAAIAAGVVSFPSDIIELLPDVAENKVVIQFNYYETDIDFTIDNSIREVIGFDSRIVEGFDNPGEGPVPFFEEADNVARFNNTDYYLIKCSSLVTRGLQRNQQYLGILARIDVSGAANSKIVYDPRQVPEIPAPELRGIDLSSLTFQLVNQEDILVDTRDEFWSLIFEIHYDIPTKVITESA